MMWQLNLAELKDVHGKTWPECQDSETIYSNAVEGNQKTQIRAITLGQRLAQLRRQSWKASADTSAGHISQQLSKDPPGQSPGTGLGTGDGGTGVGGTGVGGTGIGTGVGVGSGPTGHHVPAQLVHVSSLDPQ